MKVIPHPDPQFLHRNGISLVLPLLDIRKTARFWDLNRSRRVDLIRDDHRVGQPRVLYCEFPQGTQECLFLECVDLIHPQTLDN